jgi:hypothetical protein
MRRRGLLGGLSPFYCGMSIVLAAAASPERVPIQQRGTDNFWDVPNRRGVRPRLRRGRVVL